MYTATGRTTRCTGAHGKRVMATMKELELSKVYQLLEPGPVVLLTTARKGRANVMVMAQRSR